MELHKIKPQHPSKRKKRVGRGGKRGTYSGRGIKGQKARAGAKIRPVLRDIMKKFPKKRGYRFKSLKEKPVALNLRTIEKKFKEGERVNLGTLKKKNLVKNYVRRVKILGVGRLSKKLVFEKLEFSQSAQEKIKKAGGKIVAQEEEKTQEKKEAKPETQKVPQKTKTEKTKKEAKRETAKTKQAKKIKKASTKKITSKKNQTESKAKKAKKK